MKRHAFQHNGLAFSYLDSGGDGPILIALHAHWMEASTFVPFAAALAPEWRVIALDQRGHGSSDHTATYTRDDYIIDLHALFVHLHLKKPVVLLGNSLGGVNAYQFAAQHPDLVRGIIVEDIGVEISADINFFLVWDGIFKTRQELENCVGPRFLPYLEDSFRETKEGWRLPFNPQDMLESNRCITGNYWKEWLATDCPLLLLRGKESRVTTRAHLEEMSLRRPNTFFQTLESGHVMHLENPTEFIKVVRKFLKELESEFLQQLIFRRAEHRDLSAILKLLVEDELGKTRESLSEVPEPCYEEAFQKITADSNNYLMVVELENQIIGTCHLTLLPSLTFRGGTRLQVEAVRIAEAFCGRGIGEWMFQKIFAYAHQQNVSTIQLTTNKVRTRAKKFYERLGFTATHEGMKMTL